MQVDLCKRRRRQESSNRKEQRSRDEALSLGVGGRSLWMASLMVTILVLLSCCGLSSAFISSVSRQAAPAIQSPSFQTPSAHLARRARFSMASSCLNLVTEDDVLEAVEKAEALWAKALEARKTANALSDRAEEEAEAAACSSKEVDSMFQNRSQPISMQQLAQADAAARSNLDAGGMVNRALQASDDADEMERLAEEALQKSEEKLEQHLIDFPDSPLAE